MGVNTHSQVLKPAKLAKQWQAERARLVHKPLWDWRGYTHTHTHTHKKNKGLDPEGREKRNRDCPQSEDHNVKDRHKRGHDKNDVHVGEKK